MNQQLVLINVLYKTQKKRPSHYTVLSIFSKMIFPGLHTVPIWPFTFHKKSGLCSWFWRPISNQPAGRIHKLFDLKIQIYYTHFSSFFAGIVKSNAFFTLSLLFQKGWYIWVIFCVKSQLQYFNSLEQQWQCKKSSGF